MVGMKKPPWREVADYFGRRETKKKRLIEEKLIR